MGEQELFMKTQVKKIETDKWIAGVHRHRDPGDGYVVDWVDSNAEKFRSAWNMSACRTCVNCCECGFNVVSACDKLVGVGIYDSIVGV